jgi:rRNA-processing protein FCF1
MKILIDTNIFLDFYRTNSHPVNIFNSLKENINSIILTDQIIQEFERSRENVLTSVKQRFQLESKLEDFSSSYLQNLDEFHELVEIQKRYKGKQKEILNKINEIILNPSLDPIATYFKEFVDEAINQKMVFYTSDEIIHRADKRKKIGNPPVSNKYSIGDEINWEIILENVNDDLIIVGRDNTFTNNLNFLQKDFHRKNGKIIYSLTDSIVKALELAGINTSNDLKEEESKALEQLKHFNQYWKHNSKEE